MTEEKPHAALIRENGLLRSVAAKAIRLRRIGLQCDSLEETMEAFYRDNPEISRSSTQRVMFEQAFTTAMNAFDHAVLEAAEAGMDWAQDHGLAKPKSATV